MSLVLLAIVPVFALSFWQNLKLRKSETNRVTEGMLGLSRLIAANEAGFVKNAEQLLATVASFAPLVLGTNKAFSEVHLQNLLKLSPDYINFGLIEQDGTVFVSALPLPEPKVNLSDRSYFRRVVATRAFAVGDYQVGRISRQPTLNFGYPIFDEKNNLRRVFFASLDLKLISEAASRVPLPPGASLSILDSSGVILAQLPSGHEWVGRAAGELTWAKKILQVGNGAYRGAGFDEIERVFSVTTISAGASPSIFVAVGIPTGVLFHVANRSLLYSLLFLTAVTCAALLASKFLAEHSLLRPISTLVTFAEELGRGDLSHRVSLQTSVPELLHLGDAFNLMAGRLEKKQNEITSMNQDLERKVQERTSELNASVQELESFSYAVSHDLRAPLRHLDGFTQLLEKSQRERMDEKGLRYLDVISQSARKMGTLIDDLLSFSRMGRKELLKTSIDLNALARDVIAELQPEIGERSVKWDIANLPAVQADPSMLKQVLVNLFSNALKYSKDRATSEISFHGERDNGFYKFTVADNGVGFDMRFAHKLFQVFQRLHSDSEFEGTGIGLANVRRIINRHGGETWAEATPGQGAKFHFSLPVHD